MAWSGPSEKLRIRSCGHCTHASGMSIIKSHSGLAFPGWSSLTVMLSCSAWVRSHAQDYILRYFRLLTEKRKTAHSAHLDHLTAHAYHHYNAPPAPQAIQEAHANLKRGIDADWQASVARYPEVLAYFYSLVELHLPAEDDPVVCDPPLGALQPSRKSRRRNGRQSVPPPAIAQAAYGSGPISPRTPPPTGRRTPGSVRRPTYRQSASYPHYHMV